MSRLPRAGRAAPPHRGEAILTMAATVNPVMLAFLPLRKG
jgi:hypothetical protein